MADYSNKVLKGDQLLVYTQQVKTELNKKQEKISADNKLDYALLDNAPAIPTNNNQLTNGAGYQTAQQVSEAITQAVAGIGSFSFQIVENLPSTGSSNVIYLKLKAGGSGDNIYTEYAYINGAWEVIGDTSVSLDFLTNADVSQIWTDAV